MKKIVIACGSGVATSQNVASRLEQELHKRGVYSANVVPVDIKSIDTEIKYADIYVSLVPDHRDKYPIPTFNGIAFLTGFNLEEEIEKIIKALES